MLDKYKCRVKPSLDSEIFTYFEQAINRRRILDKWFYFYKNNPTQPVIIWKSKHLSNYQLQPGTNRYIGTALRNNNEWIDGIFITDDHITTLKEIEILNLIESIDMPTSCPDFYQITLDNPVHKWGIGDQTLYDPAWIQPVYDWVHNNVKYTWGLKFNKKIYYVNSERRISSIFKKTKHIVDANDYPSLQLAVQELFKIIT
jgi:hypothetical protein